VRVPGRGSIAKPPGRVQHSSVVYSFTLVFVYSSVGSNLES
jgi:hypothetical protein